MKHLLKHLKMLVVGTLIIVVAIGVVLGLLYLFTCYLVEIAGAFLLVILGYALGNRIYCDDSGE